jgi:hypothetical protein
MFNYQNKSLRCTAVSFFHVFIFILVSAMGVTQACAAGWEQGVEYFFAADGSCVNKADRVCMTEAQYKSACLEAKGVTQHSLKLRGVLETGDVQSLMEGGQYGSPSISYGTNRRGQNVCAVSITVSGIVNGSSRRLEVWGIAQTFRKASNGELLVSYFTNL